VNGELIDTHAHIDFPEFDLDRDEVVARAQEQGVLRIINIGSSLEGSKRSVELAGRYPGVYATVGIHPHEADSSGAQDLQVIKELLRAPKVVAIGEVGLDYFKNFSTPENQRALFRQSLAMAKPAALPLVLHCRQAQEDLLSIIKEFLPLRAVVHCFCGNQEFLSECVAQGFYISFTCTITYKNAQGLRDMVKAAPLDRLMLETDAPYLSPEGLRGKRNEPANVRLLAAEVARIKELSIDEVARVTTDNAKRFFNLG
jgi:TatD DNase family protein